MFKYAYICFVVLIVLLGDGVHSTSLSAQGQDFYSLSSQSARKIWLDEQLDHGISNEDLLALLSDDAGAVKLGRPGTFQKKTEGKAPGFYYTLITPTNLDPEKRYPVIIFLHGGINTRRWRNNGRWWGDHAPLQDEEYIKIFPASWSAAKWWTDEQVDNLSQILSDVKSQYRTDTNRVYLVGISDGGSGIFYAAARVPHLFAAVAPVIGSPVVIASNRNGALSETFPANYANVPWLIINGSKDPVYPAKSMKVYAEQFAALGAKITFGTVNSGHSFATLFDNYSHIKTFFSAHTRTPYPSRVVWQTDKKLTYHRASWLVVDELRSEDDAVIPKGLMNKETTRSLMIAHAQGNVIDLKTYGIKRLRVLISPFQFDVKQAIHISVNGVTRFNEVVKAEPNVLAHWAAIDMDPNRLYVAELALEI